MRSMLQFVPGLRELINRLLVVLLGVVVYRLGVHVPLSGVDLEKLSYLFANTNGIVSIFNTFSGGALSRLSIFALGVMPYISASIIMQLMGTATPHLAQLKKEGDRGRNKINMYTKVLSIGIAILQGTALIKLLISQDIANVPVSVFFTTGLLTLTTGSLLLIWIGEQMTEHGIGNGVSIIIFAGIVSRIPPAISGFFTQLKMGNASFISLFVLLAFIISAVLFVLYIEMSQRKIKLHHMNRNQAAGNQSLPSHLPIKINMAGVIPPIFATAILSFPGMLFNFLSHTFTQPWLSSLAVLLAPGSVFYLIFSALAIIVFSFFYTSLIFDPNDTANNLKRSSTVIPGIRPGKKTADYLEHIAMKITVIGSMYLCAVVLMPQVLASYLHVPIYMGGTSILIVVVVLMDIVSQIQNHLLSFKYENIMKRGKMSKGKSRHGINLLR